MDNAQDGSASVIAVSLASPSVHMYEGHQILENDAEILKGLEVIQKLDKQLEEVEQRCTSSLSSSNRGGKTSCPAHGKTNGESSKSATLSRHSIRHVRKQRAKDTRLKQILDNQEKSNETEGWMSHILRNIKLGPNARYFTLKPEEETLVEKLLQEDEAQDSTSQDNLGFEMLEEDLKRVARIDMELLQYQSTRHEQHEDGSSTGDKENLSVYYPPYSTTPSEWEEDLSSLSAAGARRSTVPSSCRNYSSLGKASTHSEECASHVPSTSSGKKMKSCCNSVMISRQQQHLSNHRKPSSVVDDYLDRKKDEREFERQREDIDKKLRELQLSDPPQLTTEDISRIIYQCKCENEIMQKMFPPFLDHGSGRGIITSES